MSVTPEGIKKSGIRRFGRSVFLILLPLLLAIVCWGFGRLHISVAAIFRFLNDGIRAGQWDQRLFSVLINLRLPRIILALACGAALSVSGATFQSVFANPLASPDTLAVAAGAGFGAALALYNRQNMIGVQLSAMGFGFIAVCLTYAVSRIKGRVTTIMIVLSGMVVAALFQAGISLIMTLAESEAMLPAITFWLMGSLASARFNTLLYGMPLIIIGMTLIFAMRWRLNVMALSDDEARTLGVNVQRMRLVFSLAATMMIAAAVSMAGQIGWVGLLIPHICRMCFGSDHRDVIPASISFGGSFLLLIDSFARTASAAEIPLSIITAILGAPLFIFLLHSSKGDGL